MSEIPIVGFTTFLVACLFVSIGVIRAAHYMYAKMLTCHPAKHHLKYYSDLELDELTPGEDYERLFKKVGLLSVYNFVVVLTITGFLYLYTRSPLGSSIQSDVYVWIAVILIALIMNLSIRVASLSDLELNTPFYNNITERSLGFGYGFILTTYFMTLFGLSTYAIQSGLKFDIDNVAVSNNIASMVTLLVIFGPIICSLITTLLLHPRIFGVREYNPISTARTATSQFGPEDPEQRAQEDQGDATVE